MLKYVIQMHYKVKNSIQAHSSINIKNTLQQYPLKYRPISYLVVEGYTKEGREDLENGGATTAGQLYADMLIKCTPTNIPTDYEIVYPADPNFKLPDLSKYHGVGWSGSSLTVYKQEDDRVKNFLHLAKACYANGIPQFGSCFGAQLAVVVAGGIVQKNPLGKELGITRKVQLTLEGQSHPMFYGKPHVFGGFTSHNDQITHLPNGIFNGTGVKLAHNFFTSHQAIAIQYLKGEFWGLQYHPEYDLHEFARLLSCRRQVSVKLGFFNSFKEMDAYIEDLELLHLDPTRKDIAWRLGIDTDVMDHSIRTCEVGNFIKFLVLPYYLLCSEPCA